MNWGQMDKKGKPVFALRAYRELLNSVVELPWSSKCEYHIYTIYSKLYSIGSKTTDIMVTLADVIVTLAGTTTTRRIPHAK